MLHVTASRRRAAAAVLAAVGVMLFGGLLESVAGDWGPADLDWPVLQSLVAHRGAALTAAARAVHAASEPWVVLAAAALVAAVWAGMRREFVRPALLLGALLADALLVTGTRYWVGRERPPAWFDAVGGTDGPTFPSAHTSTVLTLLAVAVYFVYSRRASRRGFTASVLAVMLLTAATAASDLYLGRHWLTDIAASVAIAAVVLAGVVWADTLRNPAPSPSASSVAGAAEGAEVAVRRAPADT